MDSEEEEKSSGRKKKKRRKKKQLKIEYEELTEWKEADDMKWESEEIRISDKDKNKDNNNLNWKYRIENLRDSTAYGVRIRGRNISGWGSYSTTIKFETPLMTIASKILKSKEIGYLMKILPKKLRNRKYKLLFRASRDGFQSSIFHSKCDNRGETLSIIHSTSNHIFGGYTSIPWSTTSNNYVYDQKAFIFLLRSTRGNVPLKWNVTNAGNAVYHNISYGPTFGGGFDFYLCNNCNTTNSSYSNLGNSYGAPKDKNLLAGSYNFQVKDYEVWQIK